MDDTCTITHDAQSTQDDTLNTTTGALAPPNPDTVVIYTGRCKVSPMGASTAVAAEGGQPIRPRAYRGSIPWDSPMPSIGAILKVTSSRRDLELVDQEFIIMDVMQSTFLVSRRMVLERR